MATAASFQARRAVGPSNAFSAARIHVPQASPVKSYRDLQMEDMQAQQAQQTLDQNAFNMERSQWEFGQQQQAVQNQKVEAERQTEQQRQNQEMLYGMIDSGMEPIEAMANLALKIGDQDGYLKLAKESRAMSKEERDMANHEMKMALDQARLEEMNQPDVVGMDIYNPDGTQSKQYADPRSGNVFSRFDQGAKPQSSGVTVNVGEGNGLPPPPKLPTGEQPVWDPEAGHWTAKPVPGSSAENMNVSQGAAATFADRVLHANEVMNEVTEDGVPLDTVGTSLSQKIMGGVPVVGNYMVSDDHQKLDQAQRNFINAILRRESGAVIAESEFDNARKQYFPQPGDSPQVIDQKRRNRVDALVGLQRDAGNRYTPNQGNPNVLDPAVQPPQPEAAPQPIPQRSPAMALPESVAMPPPDFDGDGQEWIEIWYSMTPEERAVFMQ